jgi:DMSO reductase family type II enzyme chaperone
MTAEPLQRLEARHAAARSLAYNVFALMFEYPDGERGETIRSGELVTRLREALVAIDPTIDEVANWDALRDAGEDDDDLAVEFTRLFDVGAGAPPCPLHGGLYFGARMKTMEEAVRFYNFFGLTLSETQRELPDHLTTQLEFLHFLAFREAEVLEERDFVARHPGRWVPELRKRLEAEQPMPFFRELICRLASFLESESLYLASATSES